MLRLAFREAKGQDEHEKKQSTSARDRIRV